MGRYTGPKDRLSRREGVDLFGKGMRLTRLNIPPGQHGHRRTRRPSQYGEQLREKQKVKRMYGLREKQFASYVKEALKSREKTADALFAQLESRLDNVIFRLGFAETRPQARQLVSHRHVYVNGKRVNIPSYQVKAGETITLSKKAMEIPGVSKLLQVEAPEIPSWLQRKAAAGQIKKEPTRQDVGEVIDEANIIEYYSR